MTHEQIEILEDWYSDQPTGFMRQGSCQGMETNLFFPYKGEPATKALQICNGTDTTPPCPVRTECLEYALSLPALCVGIWGGTSQRERRRIKAERASPQPVRFKP